MDFFSAFRLILHLSPGRRGVEQEWPERLDLLVGLEVMDEQEAYHGLSHNCYYSLQLPRGVDEPCASPRFYLS